MSSLREEEHFSREHTAGTCSYYPPKLRPGVKTMVSMRSTVPCLRTQQPERRMHVGMPAEEVGAIKIAKSAMANSESLSVLTTVSNVDTATLASMTS